MVKGKLILISQSGSKFFTNDDGSMSYSGGEEHAVEINHETSFDDLRLKLAELWNLQSKTLSIKYFLPGNRKTLICISNDRDLKWMKEFYVDSITADLFISGEEGFDQESLNMNTRNDVIVAEAVTPANPSKTKPKTVRIQMASSTSANRSPNHAVTHNHGPACSDPPCSVDMDASPADAVKKRRRAASRAVTANGPTQESKEVMSRKKNKKNHGGVAADNGKHQLYFPSNDYCDDLLDVGSDMTPGKLAECWKDIITGVGQDFTSVQQFRDALQKMYHLPCYCCLRWKATGLPCCHAIAVLTCTHRNVYCYCTKHFTVDNFHRVYSDTINPVSVYLSTNPASDDLDNNDKEVEQEKETEMEKNVLPPCNSRPYGQTKKEENTTTKKSRKTVTCTKCKGRGHNKATCKETS